MGINFFESVGYKDFLLHTRISYYLEQSLSELCADSKTPFPRIEFRDLHDRLAYDIALLVRLGVFEWKKEEYSGAVFSNDSEAYRGFVSLSSPEGIDPVYPTMNACTNKGDDVVRYHTVPLYVDPEDMRFAAHQLAHDPESATFAFSAYLWYLFLYEQKEIRYVNADNVPLTSSISLVPSTRIFSAQDSFIDSKIALPEGLEYLELSGAHVDASIRLPQGLKGYAAARTRTGSLLHAPATVLDLDLYDCPADDDLALPPFLENFCAPKYYNPSLTVR